ncbi:PREDICTED: uncharacterized protein LOC104763627 isoform X2 [Camelina sativa]|uniref:Uncharacterized protein LOC104763627 isoform X2 n=1 Tax=Camelina sativa TaxID=90675 RepID=A0ABM1RAI0_CAMSA|nr:PREDICTED: uncharacterized protein LOC104763627 isoform X2 [Camelina sativa]
MAEAMETEMELSDGEQTNANNAYVAASQNSASAMYNRNLLAAYGNSPTGLEKVIQRRPQVHHEQLLPGYIFMCNARTKNDCYRYRVFGVPRGRRDVVESIKPGMKLFLYDFEKRLLYGVYEATTGGRLDIEPEAFDMQYPAQVGFRILMNCYPLPENAFKSAIYENYKGPKFNQELAPHQVMSLLSLFRPFTAPEIDLLPQRLASRAPAPRTLSFEERFIAATQLRNASSVLDPLSARHAEPRPGSLMAHQSAPRTSLLQHSYSRQDDYTTPPRDSLSNLNQPYYPTEARQQRLLGDPPQSDPPRSDPPRSDPPRSSIQDPQLKYLTILSNIRRYGTASDCLASESEYIPATPSEKDQFASPYSDNKYHPSTLSGNEHPSAPTANGSVYRSEFYTSPSQKEGEASQQHEIPARTYYHPEASTVSNTTVSMQPDMQAVSASQSHTETAGYPTPAHGEASQPAAGAIAFTHQPQSVAGNYTKHIQAGNVEESTQSYAGTMSYPQQQYYAAMGHTTQLYAGGTGYVQNPHEIGYAQQPHVTVNGYPQQPHATATEYFQQPRAATAGYTQQHHAASTGYSQQPAAGYALQPHAQAAEYTTQPHAQAVGYMPQYHPQTVVYNQQGVMQGSVPGAPGTADWNAANQAYSATGDWNAVNQSYYPQTADATTAYYQTS